jgi:hypothetical protein
VKPGDMVFLKVSILIDSRTPLIIIETFGKDYCVVLDPSTGQKLAYQEHNLTEFPT